MCECGVPLACSPGLSRTLTSPSSPATLVDSAELLTDGATPGVQGPSAIDLARCAARTRTRVIALASGQPSHTRRERPDERGRAEDAE